MIFSLKNVKIKGYLNFTASQKVKGTHIFSKKIDIRPGTKE